MAALKVASFDMLRRRVNVTEAVAEVRGHVVWDTPKGHERRSVPFPAFLTEPLAALMVGKGRDDLVFAGEKGAVLRVSTFRPRIFAPAVARCRSVDDMLPKITPHDLRHTAVSLAKVRGIASDASFDGFGDRDLVRDLGFRVLSAIA
jgi:integrase